jgi:hypothetical protein
MVSKRDMYKSGHATSYAISNSMDDIANLLNVVVCDNNRKPHERH